MGLFLHQTTTRRRILEQKASLFMGLFLHQTTTIVFIVFIDFSCLWVFSYIKPQHGGRPFTLSICCLWVFSYIKPQPVDCRARGYLVVYGSFPTSNHNRGRGRAYDYAVVYGSFPTSNHNTYRYRTMYIQLFMGLFLHQTTTLMNQAL